MKFPVQYVIATDFSGYDETIYVLTATTDRTESYIRQHLTPTFTTTAASISTTISTTLSTNTTAPHDSIPDEWSLMLGMVVTMFVMIVGSLGNLLTLCTLAHQFHLPRRVRYIKDLTPDTVLIINLAFADLFYSSISLPFMFTTYYRLSKDIKPPWEPENNACRVSAFLRYINAITEWTTLGLMALERCVTIYNYRNCRRPSKWFTTKRTIVYCLLVWLVSIACQLPTLFGVFGEYGYNPDYAKCDFRECENSDFSPRMMFFALESIVPCVLILIGNTIILVQVYISSSSLMALLGSKMTQRQVALRRSRTTRVILKLLSVYLICVLPVCIYNIRYGRGVKDNKEEGIVLYCIYWFQYCINNFIYVVSNGRYRRAYVQFLAFITCKDIPKAPHITVQRRDPPRQVFVVNQRNLQVPVDLRYRTPSECEEARRRRNQGDYAPQENSPGSSISSGCQTLKQNECPMKILCPGWRTLKQNECRTKNVCPGWRDVKQNKSPHSQSFRARSSKRLQLNRSFSYDGSYQVKENGKILNEARTVALAPSLLFIRTALDSDSCSNSRNSHCTITHSNSNSSNSSIMSSYSNTTISIVSDYSKSSLHNSNSYNSPNCYSNPAFPPYNSECYPNSIPTTHSNSPSTSYPKPYNSTLKLYNSNYPTPTQSTSNSSSNPYNSTSNPTQPISTSNTITHSNSTTSTSSTSSSTSSFSSIPTSNSLSSTSSLQQLVRVERRSRCRQSIKEDLRKAGKKLRRTFSS